MLSQQLPYKDVGVVSLWDVLKFNAHKWMRMVTSEAFSQGVMKASAPNINATVLETTFIPDDVRQGILNGLGPIALEFERFWIQFFG